MIAALDTHGDLYIMLMQSNTNEDTLCHYMEHLVKQLDKDRPDWRDNTVLQLDGAKYHMTDKIKAFMKKNRVPAIVSGAYSYDASVCELFFAMFKRGEINIQ